MTESRRFKDSDAPLVVEKLAANERAVVYLAVGFIFALTGLYTVFGVGMDMSALEMTRMSSMAVKPMEMAGHWTFPYAALVFLMWWIMMIAMMVPSAAPTLLLFTALKRQGQTRDSAALTGGLFLSGYLLAWAGFSLGATLLQWQLGNLGLISATSMTIGSRVLASTVLIIAGLYQFTKLKDACLEHCRSPAHFLARHNRPGLLGAWKMGAHHGAFCLGCCWALMALLFVGGVMNLYWIAGLALYVMAEKLFPFGATLSRLIGAGLIVAGVAVLLL